MILYISDVLHYRQAQKFQNGWFNCLGLKSLYKKKTDWGFNNYKQAKLKISCKEIEYGSFSLAF